MGREVRKVPADWKHPKDKKGHDIPLFPHDEYFGYEEAAADWTTGRSKWMEGFVQNYSVDLKPAQWKKRESHHAGRRYTEYAGPPPNPDDYMPKWTAKEATHLQMYETCSEGLPISPVMETPEELARWLADNNASVFGNMTATYEQWLVTCRGRSAPTMMMTNGAIRSGVAAVADCRNETTKETKPC